MIRNITVFNFIGFYIAAEITDDPKSYKWFMCMTSLLLQVCLARINDTTICENLSNGSYEAEENLVQASSSHWLLAAMLSYQIPGFIASFIYGALSDRVSRKLVLLLPSVGHLIGAAFLLLNAMCPQWPMAAVMLCPLAAGIGGGWMTCLLACFSYLSEVRTFHFRSQF